LGNKFYGNSVTQLRASDGQVLNTVSFADGLVGVAFINGYVWVANYGSSSVMQVEPKRGSEINTIKVGKSPSSVIFDGTNIWIANGGSNSVSRLSL
jgi:YVTN family beta-propeller protein